MASKDKKNHGFDIGIFVMVLVMLLFIGSVVFVISKESSEEKALMNETRQVGKIIFSEKRDKERLNKLLNRTVTKGKYTEYETAYKKYVSECYSNYISIDELLSTEDFKKYATVKNYLADGQEFNKSLDKIRNYKNSLTEYYSKFNSCSNLENALTYVDKQDEKSSEYKLYKDDLINSIMLNTKDKTTLDDNIKNTKELLDNEEELLLFLKNNAKFWTVVNDSIIFYTNTLIDEYKGYLDKIK